MQNLPDAAFATLCFLAGFLGGLAVRAPVQTTLRGVLWVAGLAAAACTFWLVYIVRTLTNTDTLGAAWRTFTVTGIVFWAAWTLWRLRQRQRVGYGIAEVLFGLTAAGYLSYIQAGDPLINALSVSAAAYVVVRGLDNIDVGLLQPQHEPLRDALRKLRSWRLRRK